jgi:dTDP-4-amino-4,6-dideoxygalactose transaminase
MPSFTFVSTANAFMLRGAKIVLADSNSFNPNIEENSLEKLITKNTKVIVVVHYAGIACNMEVVMAIAEKHSVFVVEDAAQAIDSFYFDSKNSKQPLGSIGHMAAFSFHESKNIQCGEGGMLVVNDERFTDRSEIIWEKGTNRAAFFRGEVDKYNWVDIGSSFLPSEITAAFLYAQLQSLDEIQKLRKQKWQLYYQGLLTLQVNTKIRLPYIPGYAIQNAHIFYVVCQSLKERNELILFLKEKAVQSMFHYPGLHTSPLYLSKQEGYKTVLENAEQFSDCLLRLPLYAELDDDKINLIIQFIYDFFE